MNNAKCKYCTYRVSDYMPHDDTESNWCEKKNKPVKPDDTCPAFERYPGSDDDAS